MSTKKKSRNETMPKCIIKSLLFTIVVYLIMALVFSVLIEKGSIGTNIAQICSWAAVGVAVLIGYKLGSGKNKEKRLAITATATVILVAILFVASLLYSEGDGGMSFLYCVISVCSGWALSLAITRRIKKRRR